MLVPLLNLVREWTARRARLRTLLASTDTAQSWLYSIRLRIIAFLLSRYDHRDPSPAPESHTAPPAAPPVTFCVILEPVYSPPRPHRFLAAKLRDITRCNARPRWRFWP